jgi:hypothetical protein
MLKDENSSIMKRVNTDFKYSDYELISDAKKLENNLLLISELELMLAQDKTKLKP